MMGDPPKVVIGDPTNNLREVEKEIGELVQSDGGTDLAATFEKVDWRPGCLVDSPEGGHFLDRSAGRELAAAGRGDRRPSMHMVARIEARRPRSVVIDLGKSGGENRAVTDLRLDVPVVTIGATVFIRADLRNFGSAQADGVRRG